MGCTRYSAANRLEVLLDEDDFRSSSRALERRSFLLVSQLHVAILTTLKVNVYFPRAEWTNLLVAHSRVSPFMFGLRLRFRLRLRLSTSSTDTGTQLWLDGGPSTGLAVLEFLLSRPNKTSFPISWVNEPDCCSLTGLPILDNWVFDFGWIRWESLLLPATSESNSFIQLSLKEIFGGGRGDICTFS